MNFLKLKTCAYWVSKTMESELFKIVCAMLNCFAVLQNSYVNSGDKRKVFFYFVAFKLFPFSRALCSRIMFCFE